MKVNSISGITCDVGDLFKTANREFVLRDPDGYKLAFFEKK
jgi:hypothetical protein